MSDRAVTRAFRNSNPGNLEAKDHWQGLMAHADMTEDQRAEVRFAVFQNATWGFRALAKLLLNYQRKYQIGTVRGIINRFAPSNENDTRAYVAAVAYGINHGADDHIDLSNSNILRPLCKAIAIHESGAWVFADSDLNTGVAMAEGAIS